MREAMFVECMECGREYERKHRGRVTAYCGPCRVVQNRHGQRARDAAKSRGEKRLEMRLATEISLTLDEFADLEFVPAEQKLPVVSVQMPAGYKSPMGSDDGRSTYFEDLSGYLDHLSSRVAQHLCRTEGLDTTECPMCFFDAHPHWAYDL